MSLELFCVNQAVRLLPCHPFAHEATGGKLFIWILANSPEDAAIRFNAVASQLPYELIDGDEHNVGRAEHFRERGELMPCENHARKTGLMIYLQLEPTPSL